ncbi:MAG: uroporphyrinogen decarboxylase family protein [Chloroflexota bacterium]
MKTAERTRIAFQRGTPDRVPIHCWLGLPLIRTLKPNNKSMRDMLEWWIDDPLNSIVKLQAELGLDPMITTYSQHLGEMEIWPRMLFPRPLETADWHETFYVRAQGEGWREHQHQIHTPAGDLDYSYRTEDGYGTSSQDYLLKGGRPEAKLDALRYFPGADLYDMSILKGMVAKVGDEAWWLHHCPGPWDMAAQVRGIVNLSLDLRDRPRFVHDLMRVCTDWLKGYYRRLGETGIHSMSMNETWVGVGLAPAVYREFIKPYDEECIAAAHAAGYLVSFHNCGRGTQFLEDMIDTGPDALETITSRATSGDFELADVKQRVGRRVCLFGGFNEHTLKSDNPDDVRREVKRCLDAAAEGGGYILRSTGQIFHAEPGMIELMSQTARAYGRYN